MKMQMWQVGSRTKTVMLPIRDKRLPQLIRRHGTLSVIDVLQPFMVVTATGETTFFKEGESIITLSVTRMHMRTTTCRYYIIGCIIYNLYEARMSRFNCELLQK